MNKVYLRFGGLLFILVLAFTIWGVSSATPGGNNLIPVAEDVWTPDSWIYLPTMSRHFPTDTIFGYEHRPIAESHGLELMATAQADWVRLAAIWWPDVEPTKGTYNWSALSVLEQEFIRAHERSMEVIIVVRGTPDWAQAPPPYDETCGRIDTSEFASFANFMVELLNRYSGHPYYVKYWQIWNEPDVDPRDVGPAQQWMGCWGTRDKLGEPFYEPFYGGGYYADMLKVVYPAMKTANPDVQVITGALLLDCDPNQLIPNQKPPPTYKDCSPSLFFEGILANGGGPYFDGVGFNAYDYIQSALGEYYNPNWASAWNTTGPGTLAKASYLQGLLSTYGVTGKYLMNTESALLIVNVGSSLDCVGADKDVCENTKAYYVVQSYVAALVKGLRANIWYFWVLRGSVLFESDLTILPAYNTYKFARSELKDARYKQEITTYLGDGVRVYELYNQPGRIWVMWSLDGATHSGVVLPGTPVAVYDAFGTAMTPASTIDVGLKPLYLEWNP